MAPFHIYQFSIVSQKTIFCKQLFPVFIGLKPTRYCKGTQDQLAWRNATVDLSIDLYIDVIVELRLL